jgi:enoyl-CoA hydratase/carnithine racemase
LPVSSQVLLHCDGPVATVCISNDGKRNAMTRSMWSELRSIFEGLASRTDLRVLLVRGDAGHFCAGGDISEYASFRFDEASLKAFHEDIVWPALASMINCDLPIVAQLEGNCMGGGLEIACCCDIRMAGQSARFGAPIARLGFPMAPREAALLVSVAGAATVRDMLLAASVLDAATLAQRGFLSQVLPDDELPAAAQALSRRMSLLAPQAAQMNKQALRALAAAVPWQPHRDAYAYANSREHREGITAFLEKRAPVF